MLAMDTQGVERVKARPVKPCLTIVAQMFEIVKPPR